MTRWAEGGRRRSVRRRAVSWALLVVVLAGWWAFAAPTTVGGRTTFALVVGTSMEPVLHSGDAVLSHRRPAYEVGDLVIVRVDGGQVIHRLVDRAADGGWTTRGDNNSYDDPWVVRDEAISGRHAVTVPQLGAALARTRQNPLVLGAVCALLATLTYLPRQRRRVAPVLAAALAVSVREPRRAGRPGSELGVLVLSGLTTLASIAATGTVLGSHSAVSWVGLGVLAAVAVSGASTVVLVRRVHDGHGVPEPARSLRALSGRLHRVEELPELEQVRPVRSAVELRTVAEEHRLPVLHRVDPVTGAHAFVLITQRRGSFRWEPAGLGPPRPEVLTAACPLPGPSPAA